MEEKNETFSYTYSAKQQEEVRNIREKYIPRKEDKLEQLRKLDKGVELRGLIISITVGAVSTLIFGFGLTCCLVWAQSLLVLGIIIGIIGFVGIAAAFPLYQHIIKKDREKITPQILKLSAELMDESPDNIG